MHTLCLAVCVYVCREPPGSAVSRNKDAMVRWLSGLADKDEVLVHCMVWSTYYYSASSIGLRDIM